MILKSHEKNGCIVFAVAVLVLLVTLILYAGVLSADFVMWDDDRDILGNINITSDDIWSVFSDVDSLQRFIPLTLLAWSLIWHFAGFDPFWFHFGNWMLNGMSTLLLYFVLRNMITICKEKISCFRDIRPLMLELAAASGALLWGIHPLRVESVAWASCWGHSQAMFFLIASLFFYLKAQESPHCQRYWIYIVLSIFAYIFSLLSYPLGITFFPVFILIDIFLLRRFEFSCSGMRWQIIRPILVEKFFFAAPAFFFGIFTVIIFFRQSLKWSSPVSLSQFGLVERLMQAIYVYSYYLWKPFFPDGLAPVYTSLFIIEPFSKRFIFLVLLISGISILCLVIIKRRPFILGLWLAYLAMMLPFIGIFSHPHFTADRYSLLSSLCFSVLTSFLIARISGSFRPWTITIVVFIVLSLLAWQTEKQVKVWKNSETLFTHIIRVLENDPYRVQIMGRLAKYYNQSGQTEKSIATFMELLSIKPTSLRAHSQLAEIYHASGRYAEEIPHLRTMLEQQPNNPEFHYRFGVVLEKAGKHNDADLHFRLAESLKANSVPEGNPGENNEGI